MVEELLLLFIGIGLIAFCFYLIFSSDIEKGKKVFTYNKLTRIIAKILVTLLIVLCLYILFIPLIILLKYLPHIITKILVTLLIVLYLYILFKLITLFLPGH